VDPTTASIVLAAAASKAAAAAVACDTTEKGGCDFHLFKSDHWLVSMDSGEVLAKGLGQRFDARHFLPLVVVSQLHSRPVTVPAVGVRVVLR
jgi:hypothetical protein